MAVRAATRTIPAPILLNARFIRTSTRGETHRPASPKRSNRGSSHSRIRYSGPIPRKRRIRSIENLRKRWRASNSKKIYLRNVILLREIFPELVKALSSHTPKR